MRYSQELHVNKNNDLSDPNPFHIFLSGGAGVGKSFLTKLITAYMKKNLENYWSKYGSTFCSRSYSIHR